MTDDASRAGDAPTWFEATEQVLDPLMRAQSLLALVTGAHAAGLLAAASTWTTVGELAAASGLAPQRVRDVVRALVVNDVLEEDGDALRLAPAWQVLTGRTAFAPLTETLAAGATDARALRSVGGGADDYWTAPGPDRYAYARAVSPDPFSPGLVELFRSGLMSDPEAHRRLQDGGRHLELGCGLAGRILCLLQAHPAMTAVGVELAPDLAAEARRRAAELGVADRFEVVVGDAATVDLDEARFDTAQWSQFFFPEASRAGALRTLHTALRPGGVVEAPVLGDPEVVAADPRGEAARGYALVRVVHGGWGIPERSAAALVEEVAAAGFVDVRAGRSPSGLVRLTARRP